MQLQRLQRSHHTARPHATRTQNVRLRSTPTQVTSVTTTTQLEAQWWTYKQHNIRYKASPIKPGQPAILLVHGFGGNADHFRKNIMPLYEAGFNVYAIDLLGYGFSDKPDPRTAEPHAIYNFTNWGQQLIEFTEQVVQQPVHVVCNSVGGLAGLEAAISRPELVKGVQLLDISLRGLHEKRTNALIRPLVAAFQRLLKETSVGEAFFANVARPQTVRNILGQAYGRKDAVTDELIDCILKPGLEPGAVRVFLDFISYSYGPLPEDLIAASPRPVSILWGEADPWENVTEAKKLFGSLPPVQEFITLPGVGHCPQDEAPELVNPLVVDFCRKFA